LASIAKQLFAGLAGSSAGEFIRHTDRMLLLDRLVEAGPNHAVCSWHPPEHLPWLQDSWGIPAYVAIECMAQCVAVLAGAKARLNGFAPPLGLLLGTRHFEAQVSHLNFGVEYYVTCREIVRDGRGVASFECAVNTEDTTVAACRLTVFEQERGVEVEDANR
jgi:predicted hotdog family 3-hydroxylacyl-ACP dehydratase